MGGRDMRGKIPEVVIRRLPIYLRALTELAADDVDVVSSAELSHRTGLTSEQIRKDLAYFGAFGTRGVGYNALRLRESIRSILGLDRGVNVGLVGAGNLGTALARYNLNTHADVRIVAIFDKDPEKVGKTIEGVEIHPMEDLPGLADRLGIRMAIIAVPAAAAQVVADRLVEAGVEVMLNFSPAKPRVPDGVYVQNIDLTTELQSLAYYVRAPSARTRR